VFRSLITVCVLAATVSAADRDALKIDAGLQQRHLPFGTILDPIFTQPTSEIVKGYTRCGDSALWTGFYLAAEAYRYKVTRDPEALDNAWRALTGLRRLVYVTGNNLLARCAFPVESDFAGDIISEESRNGVHIGNYESRGYYWVGSTSRDQYVGVFFGLAAAWDLIDDPAMGATVADLTWRLIDFLQIHNWNVRMPDGKFSTTFTLRPDQQLSILAIGRHILPSRYGSDYADFATFHFFLVPTPISIEVLDVYDSYFKFNLDTVTLYNLIRLENNPARRDTYWGAYDLLRKTLDDHQNAHFNMIDYALKGANARRDQETVALLESWLARPRRDFGVNLNGQVPVCFNFACQPIPVELRVPTDFLWQRNPFQLTGGGDGFIESAGIDYLLPYWMARYYGVVPPPLANPTRTRPDPFPDTTRRR
jgi:hypothetical protein